MAELIWTDVAVTLRGRRVIHDVSLALRTGELVAVIGANGAGKTSLLRAGLGLLPLSSGTVRLDGAAPDKIAPPERARRVAYLPQTRGVAWALGVRDIVALGRFAYGAPLSRPDGEDARAVDAALVACRLESLADRSITTLSGGEQARVHMARTLASRAPLILADEPVAMLDPLHAFETMSILKRFCADGGGALVSLHDLSLAARFADRILVLREGRVLADGAPATALAPDILRHAFGVETQQTQDGVTILGSAGTEGYFGL